MGETERREREEEGAVVTMEIREGRRRWTVDEEEGEEGAIQKKQDGRGVGVGGVGGKKKREKGRSWTKLASHASLFSPPSFPPTALSAR